MGSGTVAAVLVLNGELATNFTVTPVNGAWSITQALVTVTAGSYTAAYDGSCAFALSLCGDQAPTRAT